MTERSKDRFFFKLVFSSLDKLEKLTDGSRPWRAVLGIVLVGSVLTLLLCISLWNTSFHREQLAFRAVASQIQAQAGDRLMYRRWMLVHAADRWSQGPLPPSSAGTGFAPGELVALRPGGEIPQIMGWQKLAETSRASLQRFWTQQVAAASHYDEPLISPALTDTSNRVLWLMVQPAKAEQPDGRPAGWLVTRVDETVLLPLLQDVAGWQMSARLASDQDDAGAGEAHVWHTALLPQGDLGGPVLHLEGRVHLDGWMSWLARYASVCIAAAAGIVTTLGALYAYVVLISIRLRAQALARKNTAELQRSESRNRAVVDTAPDAIITVDDQARVQWCNQATVSIFGQNLDDLRGKPLSAVVPALEGRSMQDWFRDHGIANRVLSYECKGRRAEGTEFPIAVSASRSELDKDVINTFIVRDTTDAKWAEQELLLRERALESSEDAVFITDMCLPGQPIIFANPAFERITGYEVHEVLGHNCRFLQRDDREQPAIATMRLAIEQGRPCQVVLRNYRKDGSLFWNELTISPVRGLDEKVSHYVGIASDITDRIAAEQVLNLRTERLNAVFDLSPDGFVVLDKRGELSIVNPAFERMTGLDATTLVGQSLDAFEEHLMSLCASVEKDDKTSGAENDSGMPGSRRELLHLHSPTPRTLVRRVRHGGHDNETVMYFRDITHELEVDRMKSEFLSMAAHELRTPMASIFGFTELLLKRKFDDARRQDMLSTIHRQASVLINLVNELLDLARIESRRGKDFKRKRQTLQPIIESVVSGLLIHNDDRKVQLSLPPSQIDVDVDSEKLSLAITNVLSNAYKYSPQGGDIELDLVWRDRDGHKECGIRVTDHGIGMTDEQLARVFERFFRADTSGNIPGTGLGMTIVKEIVELHGGQVVLSSQHGTGTTVVLWVPVLGQGAAALSEDLAATH
ncbi:PAS domain S-box protein [Aquabacterium lacunae]|uniref:histidine kinase n=1 Tax=Aquabacterium lacunae TaxID=2528630 RepID=A0A4Q9H2E8_9BURK|nr:PAS domain S-box protein [Aquabacterium lacunae]TBO34389.1 PAS domain S-box protein [Aquabacterium lacunae]